MAAKALRLMHLQCAAFVDRAYRKADASQAELLRYLRLSFRMLGHRHVVDLPKRVLDLALPGLAFIGHKWRSRRGTPLQAVHDESTNMAKQRWLWEAQSSPGLDPAAFAHRGGSHSFPIGITETRIADSTQVKQLQVCDVLAGAAAAMVSNRNADMANRMFYERLSAAGLGTLAIGGIWPPPDVTSEASGTTGIDNNRAVEWVAQQLRGVAPPSW